jgi:outer membrane protein assembly factor BamB
MKRVESAARYVNAIAAAAVVVGVFLQVYLIASYVFGDAGALATHETNGDIVVAFELAAFLSSLVGWRRDDRMQVWLSGALFLIGGLQVSLAKDIGNSPGVHALHGALALVVVLLASVIVARTWPVLFPRAGAAASRAGSGPKPASRRTRVWLLSVSLLAAVGLVAWAIHRADAGASSTPAAAAAPPQSSGRPWSLPNGDLRNTRVARQTPIAAANVSKLGVAWTMPLTASSIYGSFAANPVTDTGGVVYLQDLQSNVFAVNLSSGRVLWTHLYHSRDIGPNGVTVAAGKVYGATAKFAFALDAATGNELWRNATLVSAARQKAGGELASGFGIDIQPQIANGIVYLSSAALLGGGIVYALDAETGKTLWTFDSVIDPVGKKIIGGGAWNAPAVAPDGTVYFGFGNMYQPASVALANPGRRLYTDSTVALDGKTGKLKWYFQAVPNDFHDWDMQLSPIYTESHGRKLIVDSGKMGYVYALDASTGAVVWKTKVGVHNGHDPDGALALKHKLELKFPLTVEPGIVGGVETNMAVADGVVYAPVADLPSTWKSASSGLGAASFGAGRGEMVALDLGSGRILWDTKLSQMPDGDATVVNDVVFTTTFDGYLLAFNRTDGSIVWKQKLPAFTNAPIAIAGNTLITAASYPGGKGQTTEVVAFRLGAHGSFKSHALASPAAPSGSATGASVFAQNCASCHTLAAAHATGTVGPNLDQAKPSEAKVSQQVTDGGGGMPAFGGRLTNQEIDAVAKFVAASAGK